MAAMKAACRVSSALAAVVLLALPLCSQEKTPEKTESPSAERTKLPVPAGSDSLKTYAGGNGVTAPRLILRQDPVYSEEARKARVEGTVGLMMVVDKTGAASNIKVTHSLGHGLDEEAIKAVKSWKFAPATKDGVPVGVLIRVEVNFRLYEKGQQPQQE